jgi:2-polyprenyl-3-methyl-5-hydroxy-6-metoxy-1,4-benzoquinol methylase
MRLFGLSQRNCEPEIMDQSGLDPAEHAAALRGIARINWLSGSARILWRPLYRLAQEDPTKPLRILDLATGSGDNPLRLWQCFRRAGLRVEMAGADVSELALDEARKRAAIAGAPIRFFALNALYDPLPKDFDVVTSSLFLHHLEDGEAVEQLRHMGGAARQMVLVNDLIRSHINYLLACAGTRILTRSPMVHFDGPCSVAAAFTRAEARQLALRAGLESAQVQWRWPWRFLLQWRRS